MFYLSLLCPFFVERVNLISAESFTRIVMYRGAVSLSQRTGVYPLVGSLNARLLNDRQTAGGKVFDAQGLPYTLVEHADGQLVTISPDSKKVRNSLDELGCYLLSKGRTDRGLAKDRPGSFWKDS